MMKIVYAYSVEFSSHWPYVAAEWLVCGKSIIEDLNFTFYLVLINFDLDRHLASGTYIEQ